MRSIEARGRLFACLFVLGLLPFLSSCDSPDQDDFVLFAPLFSTSTYLIDKDNKVAKEWFSQYQAGQSAYLLEDGSILRAGQTHDTDNFFIKAIAEIPNLVLGFNVGGIVQRISPDNLALWHFSFFGDMLMPHHDVEMLPNGNVLLIAWEYKTPQEAIQAGRDPKLVTKNGLWVDAIFEIKPVGDTGGEVVWEWHAWDHMVQDVDASKDNYGVLSENPGKLNINNTRYVLLPADLMHSNSVVYNEELDQIILSSYNYSEFYIIDHSTTSAEAAGKSGGKYGKGGEFLYRWGNPSNYGIKNSGAFTLGGVHDPNWIEQTGHIIMFDNNAKEGRSRIVEIIPPRLPDGTYEMTPDGFYGPVSPVFVADLGTEP
ncbi:MAG: aryl-sulfate sulfotransferase, partial [Rhizobiaceae bacterium]